MRLSLNDAAPDEWDAVNRPAHYNNSGVECIDYIQQQLGDEYKGYLLGNCIKYIHRHKYKHSPREDLLKAKWYLERLIAETD
tara:strand:- start:1176 stop:1421 length:246 start_codon:yes stop_codon:yes gene_type:complete